MEKQIKQFKKILRLSQCVLPLLFFASISIAQTASPDFSDIVLEKSSGEKDFPIVADSGPATVIRYDRSDYAGVIRAINDLQNDIDSVT